MKKAKILCISILGLLFLIPFVNFSTAAPGDYVGVEEGDSYSWKISINANAITELADDVGATFDLEDLEDLSLIGSATFIAKVIDIMPETTTMVNSTLVTYVPVITNFSASIPGLGSGPLGQETVLVFSNATDYYLHMKFYPFEGIGFTFVFAAYNLNWTKAVEDVEEIYGFNPMYTGITITEESNGFKLVIPEGKFNATQKEMELKMTYNTKGVLSYAGFKYGGATAMSLTLGGDDEIPGYMLPIVVGAIAAVGIGLIYTIKKKNRM